jgi:hypothetical protein
VSLWAQEAGGAKLDDFHVEVRAKVESSLHDIVNVEASAWKKRTGTY